MSRMRAEPCAPEFLIGNCQPCHERALIPSACSVIARRPAVPCSPGATTASYSRASCSGEASRHHSTSRLVVPAMADTTTATSFPASTSRLTWRATLRMRSMSATEVPPNFITSRPIAGLGAPCSSCRNVLRAGPARRDRRARGRKGAYTYRRGDGAATAVGHHRGDYRCGARGLVAMTAGSSTAPTVDEAELARFAALAGEWWNPRGKMAPLHKFNPVRLGYIRDAACRHFGQDGRQGGKHDAKRLDCLKSLRILDIGCGGGILSEPLARLGAEVVGADPSTHNIEAAKLHAERGGVTIDYRVTAAETLADGGERFDVVLAME